MHGTGPSPGGADRLGETVVFKLIMKKGFQAGADEARSWGMGLRRGAIHRRLLSEDVAPGEAREGKARMKKSAPERNGKCRASGGRNGKEVCVAGVQDVPVRLGSQGESDGCCQEPGRMHFLGGK